MTHRNTADLFRKTILICGLITLTTAPASAQHPAFYLVDDNGDIIDPVNGENATAAFSTKQTCGTCHDYEVITKGYHFQMGWDTVADDFGAAEGRPWSLSNGFLGRWYPYAFRQLAKKVNAHRDEIDLTVYDFVGFSSPGRGEPPCGACHPGGGGLEFDRDGNRYDEHLAANPELAETLDGDYYQSQWDKSGVVEADCLVCHLEGYDFEARVDQLRNGNYKWAVVAGSRLGSVSGSVRRSREPTVTYETRLFNADGSIILDMAWPTPDDNCMYCHGSSDVKKRGFSWNDVFNPDVHNQQGISCVACHPAGLDHQIAKGYEPVSTVAPEHEGSMKTCAECHMEGYLGAPIPEHNSIRPSHMAKIRCEACHVPQLNRAAAYGHEATTGQLDFHFRPVGADAAGDEGLWLPDYERRAGGLVSPMNRFLAVYWGNRDIDGVVYPLFLREHEAGWEAFGDQIADDDEDGHQEVNRPEEIVAGLEAFASTLASNRRFEQIQPVFIKSETAFELDVNGNLVESPLEGSSDVKFSITHNTAPTRMALGADGCADCHVASAHMFRGQQTIELHGPDGAPVTARNGRFFGCNPFAFRINSLHQQIVSPYVGPLIILVVFFIVLHYHSYGPKRITFDPYSEEIERFNLAERGIHLFRLLSFVILTVTGLILAFNLNLWRQLLFGSARNLHNFHIWAGIIFIATTLGGIVLWFRDAAFEAYDKDWVRKMGGYLGHKGEVPAGRFNAGQKMFYWYSGLLGALMSVTGLLLIFKEFFSLPTICITSTIHNLLGFFLISGVLAHAYLGTIANPGTWRVLIDGSVTREWAEHHHPNWFRTLLKGEQNGTPTDTKKGPASDGGSDDDASGGRSAGDRPAGDQ